MTKNVHLCIPDFDMNNVKLAVGSYGEVSIAQHFVGGIFTQEIALIHGNGDMDIHPFSDLDSLIEVLTKVKSEFKQ